MSLTEKILQSLSENYEFIGNRKITIEAVEIEDITALTIQEVLLYYTYSRIIDYIWEPKIDGKLTYSDATYPGDAMAVLYYLTIGSRRRLTISEDSKNEIIKYTQLYNIQHDQDIVEMMDMLGVYLPPPNLIDAIFAAHTTHTNNARNL